MNGNGMFFGGGFMWIFWILVIVVLLVVIKAVIGTGLQDKNGGQESPLDILKKRYAKGEINEDEFERRRKDLEK